MRDLPPCAYDMGAPDRPGYIVFTSGSGGTPRAVVHAHRAVWARRMMWDGWYGLRTDDRVLHAGAFNWTYTLGTGLMDPWAIGATALVVAPGAPMSLLMRRHDATNLCRRAGRVSPASGSGPLGRAAAPAPWAVGGRKNCQRPHARHGPPPRAQRFTKRSVCPNVRPIFPPAPRGLRLTARLATCKTGGAYPCRTVFWPFTAMIRA